MSDIELDVSAGLSIALGSTTTAVQQLSRDIQRAASRMPVDLALQSSGVAGATSLALNLGGPSHGRKWLLRQLVIGGGVFPFTAAGSAYVFTGTNPLTAGGPTFSQLDDFTTTLPIARFYSNRQIVVWGGQNLWVVVTGGTSGTQYNVNAQVEDWKDAPIGVIEAD